MDKGFLEGCLAKGMSLEAIGKRTGKHPSTVGYWLKKHGLAANGAEKYAPRGGIEKEQLKALADTGATVAEIADHVDRNSSTVRYWLRRHRIEVRNPRRRRGDGAKTGLFKCQRHGLSEFILEGREYYRCKKCRAAAVAKHRRTVKRKLVEEAGGACIVCGYDRWIGALQFHHLDPSAKEFHIGQHGYSRSLARSRAEVEKCVLLCANCHAEVEAGFATLPVDQVVEPKPVAGETIT